MSALPKLKLSPSQYVAIENAAAFRSEFFDGEMFAMAGATLAHSRIARNLTSGLHTRLRGGPCEPVSVDQRVKVERTGLYTYPDVVIVCGDWEFASDDPLSIINPTAIIEVLSPSTEEYDRGAKFLNYQQIPSLTEYVLVSQSEPVIERFTRQTDGSWASDSFVGLDSEVAFTSVAVSIPLSEVYYRVAFPEAS